MVGTVHPIILAAFLCLPDLLVGIPVILATLLFALVTPNARFALNETPGILISFSLT